MRAGYLFAVDKRVLTRYLGPLASSEKRPQFSRETSLSGRGPFVHIPTDHALSASSNPRTHDYAGKTVRLTTAPSPIPDEFLPPLLGVKDIPRILLANSSGSSESRGSPFWKSGVSSSFLPEKMNRRRITRKDELTPGSPPTWTSSSSGLVVCESAPPGSQYTLPRWPTPTLRMLAIASSITLSPSNAPDPDELLPVSVRPCKVL